MKPTLAILTFALAVASFAAPDKTPTTIKCAVMPSNKVDIKTATAKHMYADYKGNRYFFCCGGCPEAFKKDPAKYAKGDHIKAPKPAKTTS